MHSVFVPDEDQIMSLSYSGTYTEKIASLVEYISLEFFSLKKKGFSFHFFKGMLNYPHMCLCIHISV